MILLKKWFQAMFPTFFSSQKNVIINKTITRNSSTKGEHVTDDHEITEFDHQPYVAFPEYNINRVCQ